MRRHAKAVLLVAALCSFFAIAATASADYAFRGTFASGPGSGDGELTDPGRAAIERSTGNLFVVDSGNDRVQVFKPKNGGSAEYLTQFGGGQLSEPWGIAIDEQGGQTYVYVADAGHNRIVKYDSDEGSTPSFSMNGSFTSPVQGSGAGEVGSFHVALAIDPTSHNLLVADNANKLIERFEADGSFDSSFDGSNGASAFAGPIDVAVNSTGDVYVIDASGNIAEQGGTSKALRYSGSGEYKAELSPVGPEQRPATVAINRADDSVVVSGEQDAIYRDQSPTLYEFDSSNQPQSSPALGGSSQYDTVAGLAFASGAVGPLYVVLDKGYYNGDHSTYGSVYVQALKRVFPPKVTLDPVTGAANQATFSGTVDPNGKATDYHFEYSFNEGANWDSTPTEEAGSGQGPINVSKHVESLRGLAEYRVRLVASSEDGEVTSDVLLFSTGEAPPSVFTNTVAALTGQSVFLRGTVIPNGPAATYHFEWGTDGGYGGFLPAIGENHAGDGTTPRLVSLRLDGLAAGTTYHYRLVATNSLGTEYGPDASFTTPPAGTPQYGYEMVSPPDKAGGYVTVSVLDRGSGVISPDGNSVMFTANTAFADQQSNSITNSYHATRSSPLWQTSSITPPVASGLEIASAAKAEVIRVARDQSRIVVLTEANPVSKERLPRVNLYSRELPNGPYVLLTPDALSGSQSYSSGIVGQTPDLRDVAIKTTAQLLPEAPETGEKIYVVDTATGQLRLASLSGGNPGVPVEEPRPKGLSGDGRRILFAGPGGEQVSGGFPGQLYVRDLEAEETTPLPGMLLDMAANGRYVFVATSQQLVGSDTPGTEDVYRLDLDAAAPDFDPVLVSADSEPADGTAGGVLGSVGTSADGSSLYFTMRGQQLIAGGPLAPGKAKTYFWDEGELNYVGSFVDSPTADVFTDSNSTERALLSDVSVGGRAMIAITGADLTGELAETGTEGPQMFLYDADDSTPLDPDTKCISCLPAPNKTPSGGTVGRSLAPTFSQAEGWGEYPLDGNSYVTDAGQAFFQSKLPLVPIDVNGLTPDVYTYRNGSLSLISTGRSQVGSYLLGATPDGSSVLFATADRLSGWDEDGVLDAYVARLGGGLPNPPGAPASCEGDACLRPVVPPSDPTPSSSTFSGAGNVRAQKPGSHRCAKGKVKARRHGKASCVKRKTRKGQSSHGHRAKGRRAAR